jgi:hypothetical protein
MLRTADTFHRGAELSERHLHLRHQAHDVGARARGGREEKVEQRPRRVLPVRIYRCRGPVGRAACETHLPLPVEHDPAGVLLE